MQASMSPPRQILVAVDFSEQSRQALDYAAELARPFGAAIDLVHVWEVPAFFPTGGEAGFGNKSMFEMLSNGAQEALTNFTDEAKKRGISVRSARTEPGAPAYRVTEIAREGGYDLIVVGTHGRTGLTRVLLGSVAENVVRHAPCPVLAVRTRSAG
jgi:nucleotide-binding universal stress UspA family protein